MAGALCHCKQKHELSKQRKLMGNVRIHLVFYLSYVMLIFLFFFFNDTATTEIYTLSLHDALPISPPESGASMTRRRTATEPPTPRSEEHTSELQSRVDLVCRLLLEKKKTTNITFCITPNPKKNKYNTLLNKD